MGTQSCLPFYIFSVATSALEATWATKLKIITSSPSTQKLCDPWLRGSKILCPVWFPDQNIEDINVYLVQFIIFFCVWKSDILKCKVTIVLIYCELIMSQVSSSALCI